MAFDFSGRLETSHTPPRTATNLGFCSITNKQRVSVLGDWAASRPSTDPASKQPTTFLYSDDGTCRGADGSGEAFDLRAA